MNLRHTSIFAVLLLATLANAAAIDLGFRRELFVDHYLVDSLKGTSLQLHRPVDRGPVFQFDKPWEGRFCAYVTVIQKPAAAGGGYQIYYRGTDGGTDTSDNQVTCYAESADGITWTKPQLDLFPIKDYPKNNIVLAHAAPVTHNLSPFIDTNPAAKPNEKYKAMGGYNETGMMAYASSDGIRWTKMSDKPVLTREALKQGFVFDSQNVPFYSELEGKYFLYYRIYKNKMRRVARVESSDFLNWSNPQIMEYKDGQGGDAPIEELYTNQTAPYFRAPHLYIATAARFMINRQVITTQQANAIKVDPKYFHDTCDAILLTSRGGNTYDRTFMTAFVAPGIGIENWTSRTNYPALNVVQTSPTEMSVYVNQNYAQPTSHLRRYSLRLDGFASLHAPYTGGEMLTKPLTFTGNSLFLNYSTSSPGFVKVELQDETGTPIPGFTLADCQEIIGNELDRPVSWKGGDLSSLAGKPLRLRFVMKDADVFSLRFGNASTTTTTATDTTAASTRNPQ